MSTTVAAYRNQPSAPAEHRRAVGDMVRAARIARGLSQGAIAERIGTSPVMVHYVETGRSLMPRARIAAAADILGLDPEVFDRPMVVARDEREADLLTAFRHLREDERAALLALVRP